MKSQPVFKGKNLNFHFMTEGKEAFKEGKVSALKFKVRLLISFNHPEFGFPAVSDSRSGSQRWGPSGVSCGRRADSLCGTRRRTRHTGSTAPCPAGAAGTAGPRTAPPCQPSRRPLPRRLRPRPRRKRRSRRRRRRPRR